LPDAPALERFELPVAGGEEALPLGQSPDSIQPLISAVVAHRRLASGVVGSLLILCTLYCLFAPRQYEARARVALRATANSSLNLDGTSPEKSGSFASGQTQLETLASVLRSDQLARRVIRDCRLYQAPAFMGQFARRFPGFQPEAPDPAAESYLAERFAARLHIIPLPRTLVLEIRFRSPDPMLSADVVNALIRSYQEEEAAQRGVATRNATTWLQTQLQGLKAQADRDDRNLAEFQDKHRILVSPETLDHGPSGDSQHLPALTEIDELSRELAAADSERILREAENRAAQQGDPEAVLAFDPHRAGDGDDLTVSFRSLHARHEQLEQELAQLSIERGPNFPRVVEIRRDLEDLEVQLAAQRTKLREHFRSAWQAADDHTKLVRRTLDQRTAEGLRVNQELAAYETMRRESDSTHELYLRMQDKVAEAGLAAGMQNSDVWVVDEARPPAKPVAPDPPLDFAITLFAAFWIAIGTAFVADRIRPIAGRMGLLLIALALAGATAPSHAQAPTPSTSGLPTGVARIPQSADTRVAPDPKEAPTVWNGVGPGAGTSVGLPSMPTAAPLALPIGCGDLLDVSEFHTPEFHSVVRVSASGTVKLPLIDEVRVAGMDEFAAAKAIAEVLLERGMLNHPQVFVLVTAYADQDVSVLGEVARPGVYPYGVHHRLLDLLSAASGVTAYAGGVVNIYHRNDPATPHPLQINPVDGESESERNPELAPGDIVQVSRAGLVYVVGDVIRPGGFVIEPSQNLTVLKALSLAWGASQNAALGKAILIREQPGGRTVTTLNLKRMLEGKDPDEPVGDHDILFVPNSTAKNLFNRTVESAIQSAAGVSIYAGMVYSQRF
jgi:polysaccharide export outer membrane protein